MKIFHRRDINYNSRINSKFAMANVRSAFHGIDSVPYSGPKIWGIVPLDLKEMTNVDVLKERYLRVELKILSM